MYVYKSSYFKVKISSILFGLSIAFNSIYASDVLSKHSATPHKDNFYMGAGLGVGINYFTPTNTAVSAANADHSSVAYRLFAGYNLNKNFALELGYTNFGYYENSASGNSICDKSGTCGFPNANISDDLYDTELNITNTINTYSLDLSAIARYNITDNLNVFGRVGANYLNASLTTKAVISPQIKFGDIYIGPTVNQTTNANSAKLLPLLGIGYEYNPNRFLGIRVEYDYYFSVDMNNNLGVNEGSYTPSAIFISTIYNF